ncbi:hypothetical protein DMENIID0001_086310 [Sergentomyia squamirostris]
MAGCRRRANVLWWVDRWPWISLLSAGGCMVPPPSEEGICDIIPPRAVILLCSSRPVHIKLFFSQTNVPSFAPKNNSPHTQLQKKRIHPESGVGRQSGGRREDCTAHALAG